MRRLCLILLSCLVVAPAALAATSAPGDGVLEVSQAAGVVTVNGTRGTLWGQMTKGRLTVTDPIPGDGQVFVSGAEKTRVLKENVTVYIGSDIHFRVTGGKYRLAFRGSGIDFTAVGIGTAQLTGDFTADDPGQYAVNGDNWTVVPFVQQFVRFGVQPTIVGGSVPGP